MSHKVLLIDDSITQLEVLKMQFQSSGFEVETAKDGYEGYKKVFETAPDLILSDIVMPNLNGFQLCRLLKNENATKEIPVILLTVLDKKIDKFWGNKSGADKFISKTAQFNEIEECSKKFIQERPVPEGYKQSLLNNKIDSESAQIKINDKMDELLMNSTFLGEFRDLGEFITQEELLVEKTFNLLSSFIDYDLAGIFINNPDPKGKKVLNLDINKLAVSNFVTEKIKRDFFAQMPEFSELSSRDFTYKIVKENIQENNVITNVEEFETAHFIPIISGGKLYGGICFYCKEYVDFKDFKLYSTMVNELLILFKMRYLYSETEHLSVTDGLTNLYNRRHFESNIEREYLRVKRYPADLSLAMVDIDHFKKINDTYGHQFGDYVLREISNIIVASFRKTDMVYRYGGEELAIILTETPIENAAIPLERVREKIQNYPFTYGSDTINVTVSIGIGYNFPEVKTYEMLVETADKALYKAKQTGRNKVVAFDNEQSNNILQ